jgi:hypothetical protein
VRWYTNYADFGIDSVCVADLDGDSNDELIVGHNGSGGVRALSAGDGRELWHGDGGNVWGIAAADITGDGAPEVLVTDQGHSLGVFDRKGNPLAPLEVGLYAADLHFIACGDLLVWGSKAPQHGVLALVDPSTGASKWSVATENVVGAASPLAVTPDGALVAVVGASGGPRERRGRLQVVDLRDSRVLVDLECGSALRPAWAPGRVEGEWRLLLAGWGGMLCVDVHRPR